MLKLDSVFCDTMYNSTSFFQERLVKLKFCCHALLILLQGSEEKREVTLEGSNTTVLKFVCGSSTSHIRNIDINVRFEYL